MKRGFICSLLLITTMGLSTQLAAKNIDYYRKHGDERAEKINSCNDIDGAYSNDQSCIDAFYAQEFKTVDYWSGAVDERKSLLKTCVNNKATLKKAPNCQNADIARVKAMGKGKPLYIK
ncbi:hypothetical protein [Salmonella enterica]|uniref:hypothetical protein n=1 Tax=Salmonella enterica TaxID=28901 RepID=UPI0009AAE917|nr:hypothetical protein [Salmonella enterica]HBC0156160.1 hypothetical protein [Salmonella enterica subsp. indica]HBC0167499.1 hypothetical protein [Salmonella enterica subsp. indica]